MSENTGNNAGSSSSNPPKAVPSLAKRQGDVTRGGSTKLKFIPTLPTARRAKEDVKKEDAPAASSSTSERGRGRGRGGTDARGRGRGRGGEARGGAPSRPPAVEMTASGPFAMGPAMAGSSARRTAPRANFTPVAPQGLGGAARLGAGLTQTTAPGLGVKKEGQEAGLADKGKKVDEEGEVYSDADEGVEIIDMENVRTMDWMAPEVLRKVKDSKKKRVKIEEQDKKGKAVAKEETMEDDSSEGTPGVNLANAVDLSESEEEEELEDIIDDFAVAFDMDTDDSLLQERVYLFQFPNPLPEFVSKASIDDKGKGVDRSANPVDGAKNVTFAADTKPAAPGVKAEEQVNQTVNEKLDGVVGRLEVYQSGAVKMRLSNGMLLDVNAATQPSFLQHAVYLNPEEKKLCVLGHVKRKFVVSPDIDALLVAMEQSEAPQDVEIDGLISMDTT